MTAITLFFGVRVRKLAHDPFEFIGVSWGLRLPLPAI